MTDFFRRLRALFHRSRLDRELEEEIQSHLDLLAEDLGPHAARRQFGNATFLKETSREAWGWRALDEVARDVRYALRTLRRSRGFAAVAVVTLALGIGLNIAVFTALRKVVLRPVDYPAVDRLMDVHLILTEERRGTIPMSWSYPKFRELLEWNRSFDALAAFQARMLTLGGIDQERLTAEIVSAQYFRMIGVKAQIGRVFVDEEDRPAGAQSVLLISDGLWRRQFAADPAAIGRTLRISGASFTIAGVLPPGFAGETGRTEAWAPMAAYFMGSPNPGRRAHNLEVVGRLKRGVSPRQADEDVRQLVARMERENPSDSTGRMKWSGGARPLLEARVEPAVRKSLWTLQAATITVLLIACVNLANLLLGRGAARRREIAIRLAMGTSRGALMRQLLIEPLLLAVAGGAAGLFLAALGLKFAGSILPSADWMFSFNYARFIDPASLRMSLPLALCGAGLALFTGLVFGLLPAWQAAHADVNAGLAAGLRAAGPRHIRLRHALVTAQMALALVLLAGANLMIRSFAALLATDFGVDSRGVLTLNVQPRARDAAARRAFYNELEHRAAALPGVEAAASSNMIPAYGPQQGTSLRVEGRNELIHTAVFQVSPAYFGLYRVPLRSGRVFQARDNATGPCVVVLSESAARRFFPGENPVGRRMDYPGSDRCQAEVLGVVGDVNYGPAEAPLECVVYSSTLQSQPGFFLAVRTTRAPLQFAPALRRIARDLDPEASVYDVRTVRQIVDAATWRDRLGAVLLGFMAALSLALAAVGIYGVFSYAVAARTRDIGVRVALGATRGDVLAMILREGAALAAAALAVGLPVAWTLTRSLSSQLYRVSPADPLVYASVAALLAAVALLACYLPARRATRIDPVEALRHE
ncbi:MAG: ABC transporter permease [Acidobacteriia bacterium]|nr:ABC transporter permease [Terriglobia bacterium]